MDFPAEARSSGAAASPPAARQSRSASAEQIRAQIECTRAELDDTVDQLQGRLAPRQIMHRTMSSVRHHASEAGRKLANTMKLHPVPTGLVLIGVGLLLFRKRLAPAEHHQESAYDGRESGYGDGGKVGRLRERARQVAQRTAEDIGERLSSIKEKAGEATHALKERAREAGEYVRDTAQNVGHAAQNIASTARTTASQVGSQVQRQAQKAGDWFVDTSHEHPLALGAAFFALGLTGGLSLPASKPEDRIMGPVRDELLEEARDAGERLIERGQVVAKRAVEAAKDVGQQELQTQSRPMFSSAKTG